MLDLTSGLSWDEFYPRPYSFSFKTKLELKFLELMYDELLAALYEGRFI